MVRQEARPREAGGHSRAKGAIVKDTPGIMPAVKHGGRRMSDGTDEVKKAMEIRLSVGTLMAFLVGLVAGGVLMALLTVPRDATLKQAVQGSPAVAIPANADFEKFKKDMDVAFPHLAQRVGNVEQAHGRTIQEMRSIVFSYIAMDKVLAEKFGKEKWVELMDAARQDVAKEVAEAQKQAQAPAPTPAPAKLFQPKK
jgi:hypothetical protein